MGTLHWVKLVNVCLLVRGGCFDHLHPFYYGLNVMTEIRYSCWEALLNVCHYCAQIWERCAELGVLLERDCLPVPLIFDSAGIQHGQKHVCLSGKKLPCWKIVSGISLVFVSSTVCLGPVGSASKKQSYTNNICGSWTWIIGPGSPKFIWKILHSYHKIRSVFPCLIS